MDARVSCPVCHPVRDSRGTVLLSSQGERQKRLLKGTAFDKCATLQASAMSGTARGIRTPEFFDSAKTSEEANASSEVIFEVEAE